RQLPDPLGQPLPVDHGLGAESAQVVVVGLGGGADDAGAPLARELDGETPTPPDAAWTSSTSSGPMSRRSRERWAVSPASGRPPAWTQSKAAGLCATSRAATDTYSAYVPAMMTSLRA